MPIAQIPRADTHGTANRLFQTNECQLLLDQDYDDDNQGKINAAILFYRWHCALDIYVSMY